MSLLPLIDRLAAFEPTGHPVVSLYLNAQTDQHGRDHVLPFARKELGDKALTFPPHSPQRDSFERDQDRILSYVREALRPSSNGLAVFACSGADLFEPVQLEAPLPESRLFVADQPHVYPLARLEDQYPRYAAVVLDTNAARIFVFGTGQRLAATEVTSPKTKRTSVGGWSQARYQRHTENVHLLHAKEVVEALDRVVRQEAIDRIVLAGDEVILPILRDQLPAHLVERVVDVLRLDIRTPEHVILKATLDALREQDAKDDVEKVARLMDQYRAGGLATVGVRRTRAALEAGQVDALVISADPALVTENPGADADRPRERGLKLAEELVMRARQTSAAVTFVEDGSLLADVGGVGAFLRYLM
jgi:peptide subunit release factor 1 (eRF1)